MVRARARLPNAGRAGQSAWAACAAAAGGVTERLLPGGGAARHPLRCSFACHLRSGDSVETASPPFATRGFPFSSLRLFRPLFPRFTHLQSPQSLEGLFLQDESSLIKINTLVTELKETTTQKSNFRQKQKSHEVLANTACLLTAERVNTPSSTSPSEAGPVQRALFN